MRQFGTILKFEMKNYFKNKVFVGITLFLIIAVTLVMFFPRIISLFESDEGEDTSVKEIMLVRCEDEALSSLMQEAFSQSFPEYEVKLSTGSEDDVKQSIESGEAECAFVISSITEYKYYTQNLSMYDMNTSTADALLQNVYRTSAMIGAGVAPEAAAGIMSVQIKGETVTLGKSQMDNFFYTYIMIFALYMVILLYGQMVATSVATEKSSRAMEVLITSAKPVSMMFGKVIAACLAGLIQLASVFGCAVVFFKVNEEFWGENPIIASIFDMPLDLIAYMLLFFVLGFLIYAFLYGAIGSTATKLEDINTSVMPLTFIFIIAFIVVITAMTGGTIDSMAMRICSYIPFTSPMAMFTRIAMSTVPAYEIIISVAILVASVFGVGVISAKIYRVGVVLYGTPPKIGAIIKALKKSR